MKPPLLDILVRHANHRGLVLASERSLLHESAADAASLRQGLAALEVKRRVRILAPLPFLVLKLASWSGSSPASVRKAQQQRLAHIEVPVSSSNAAAAAATHTEVGGAGEGGPDALLEEALAVLGPEADRAEFRAILARHSPGLVRRCLERVRATRTIRVSRAALFRSLLAKLSQ
jgi:hypothetical protein